MDREVNGFSLLPSPPPPLFFSVTINRVYNRSSCCLTVIGMERCGSDWLSWNEANQKLALPAESIPVAHHCFQSRALTTRHSEKNNEVSLMHDSTGNCFEFESDFFSFSCIAGLAIPTYEVLNEKKQNGKSEYQISLQCVVSEITKGNHAILINTVWKTLTCNKQACKW